MAVNGIITYGLTVAAGLCALDVCGAREKVPAEWGRKINWTVCAEVTSRPAMFDPSFMTDGDPRTGAGFTKGVEDGAEFTMRFRKPVKLTMVRFMQSGLKATRYRLLAEMKDSTNGFAVVADRRDERPRAKEWIEMPVGKTVKALRFEALAGEIGYRAVFPQIREFEVYSTEGVAGGLPSAHGPLMLNAGELPMPDLSGTEFDFRVCTDWWNYDMDGWEKRGRVKGVGLGDWPAFKSRISDFRELGVTSVRMFAESEACDNYSSFPVEGLAKERQRDWMKPWVEAMHGNGLKVYYFSHAWRVPIQQAGRQPPMPWLRWDFPYMASDALVGVNENYKDSPMYPCLLSENLFLDKWTALLGGALKAGVDGVYLMPDEYYYKGHNLSRCKCEGCRRGFKEMFGYDDLPRLRPAKVRNNASGQVMPPIPVDTEQYRKWKVFEYRKLADLFTEVGRRLRRDYPKAKFVFCDNQAAATIGNCGLENTLANDILGMSDVYDQKQVYGSGAANAGEANRSIVFTKHFAAVAGERRLLSSSGWGAASLISPAKTYNAILPDVMLGARQLEVYRLNYMQANNGLSVYKKLFRMVRLLEKWGIFETETPNDIGLIHSRASQDWWFVKANALIDPSTRGKATDFHLFLADESINKVALGGDGKARSRFLSQERVRGFGAQQTVEDMLAANGFAYSVVYAERPDNMKNLKRFKTLVIPFAYSLSRDAAKEIAAAADAGTKVVVFGQLGPTDEYGTPYPEPVLAGLSAKPGVVYIPGNPGDRSGDLVQLNAWAGLIAGNTRDAVRLWADGAPVSVVARRMKSARGWIVYLCNNRLLPGGDGNFATRSEASTVTLSLPVPDGMYTVESYSSDDCAVSAAEIDGERVIPAGKLRRFSVKLSAQEVKLLRILPE